VNSFFTGPAAPAQQGRDQARSIVVARSFVRSAQGHQNLDFARLEHRLEIETQKFQFRCAQRQADRPDSPGRKSILAKPLSSSNGLATLATLSCVNRNTVSCAALAPSFRTSTLIRSVSMSSRGFGGYAKIGECKAAIGESMAERKQRLVRHVEILAV